MKKILFALLVTVGAVSAAFGYHTSLPGQDTGVSASAGPAPTPAPAAPSPKPSATSAAPEFADGTFTGPTVDTQYGPIRVTVRVVGGRIAEVTVPVHPDAPGRTAAINSAAVPELTGATTQAQSEKISMVSGATYTSEGYLSSLQAALDQARG